MSLVTAVWLWFLLVLAVGFAALVVAFLGYLYGLLAPHLSDESAIRGANICAIGFGFVASYPTWYLVRAGLDMHTVVSGGIAAIVVGLTAGCVGTAAITGVLRSDPSLFSTSPSNVRRRYARYLTSIFALAFGIIVVALPIVQREPLAGLGMLPVLIFLCWVAAPFIFPLTVPVRRPTATERDRLEAVLDASGLSTYSVRIIDSDIHGLDGWLLDSPLSRYLFVSRVTVDACDDATLRALFVARREQKRYYTYLLKAASLTISGECILLGLLIDDISVLLAAILALALTLLEFSALRRLRYYTDDRAADTVGATELAAAFERVAVEGGITVTETPSRNWFSSTPSLSARIERLRAQAGTTAETTGGETANAD
ncbi:hypothetical protein [Natrialba aegyptia]|uniref:Peptidase n=1 Tax=Natrialba aegyptia DSM 13077 TaxID=1227491 RepID=M0AZT0_9EURY|nr:hypothetical protein [Natrialba aegyptia]ELZ03827.1 peptidase [Natrialba aegyptia DSM 13077]